MPDPAHPSDPADGDALDAAGREALRRPVRRRAALLGTGYIGGSLFLALRRAGLLSSAIGFDVDEERAASAKARGIVDEIAPSAAVAARGADLVLLAAPVGASSWLLRQIAADLSPACLVMDVGSTKAGVVAAAERSLPNPGRFVGAHPIAGTERSGPGAADPDLFAGRLTLLTPTERTFPEAIDVAASLWTAAGARVERMSPPTHDRALGAVSHLPHAAAFALAAAVDRILDGDSAVSERAAGLHGGSFADTTRVAASDELVWRDIFLANREALLDDTTALLDELTALRSAISVGDGPALIDLFRRARRGRERVMSKDPPPGARSTGQR